MSSDAGTRSERLDGIIAEYLQSTEAGQPLDREELLGRYPELAAELQEFFADQDCFARIAAPLKDPLPRRQFVPPAVFVTSAATNFSRRSPVAEWAWFTGLGRSS